MKQKVSPAAIAIAVVVLVAVVYGIYRISFAPQNPPVTKDNAPAYAKERGMVPGDSSAPGGGGGARPAYGQGAGYQPGGAAHGAPGGMGR